jgi:hypothetical protein
MTPTDPPLTPLTRRERLIALLCCAGLSVVLTWPMVLQPNSQLLGHPSADGMKHLWTLWWMRASLWSEGHLPFNTALINYPMGMQLYPIEPLNGLLAVALPFIPEVALSNLLVLLNLTLTGLCGAWFGRELSGSRLGGLAAGLLLQGSAVMAFFVHVGVGELSHLWWLPLGLGVLLRARRSLRWPWFLALAGCLAGAVLSCFYLGFFLGLAVALWALCTLWAGTQTPRLLLSYALAAGLSISVVWPVTQSFATSYRSGDRPDVGLRSYLLEEHGQPVTDPTSARLELSHVLRPGLPSPQREIEAYGGGRYLGLATLLLALVGLLRRPRQAWPWLVVGAVGLVLALGSFWTVDGQAVSPNGARLRLPAFYLNRLLGYVAEPLNFPVRFLAMTATALSGLAALAIGQRDGRRWLLALGLLVPIGVVEMQWGDRVPWPWSRFTPRDATGLEVLRAQPQLAVVDLALLVRADHENRWNALSTQIAHGKPTQAIPIERIELFARDGYWFCRGLGLIRDLQPLYENKPGHSLSGDYRHDLAVLRDAGFGWILVSYRYGAERMPEGISQALTQLLGPPVATGAGMGAWAIPAVDVAPPEIEAWRVAHMQKVRELIDSERPQMGPPQF